jgi:hypothetical protein
VETIHIVAYERKNGSRREFVRTDVSVVTQTVSLRSVAEAFNAPLKPTPCVTERRGRLSRP